MNPETTPKPIRCKLVACPKGETGRWEFYFMNDTGMPLDDVLLKRVSYEWGGYGHADPVDVRAPNVAAGTHEKIWEDNGFGVEGRMDFLFQVRQGNREATLLFEFPILYKKEELPVVEGLGRAGWEEIRIG